jgi:hypothetical protein
MVNFLPVVTKLFNIEGGYQDSEIDNGNYSSVACGRQLIGTNHGIAAKTLEEYINACPSIQRMKDLTKAEAIEILKYDFWNPIGGDNITNATVALIIFDTNVLRPVWVQPIVTQALQRQGVYNYSSKPFSAATVNAINSVNQNRLIADLKEIRKAKHVAAYNAALTSGDTESTSYKFINGYIVRCDNLGTSNVTGNYQNVYGIGDGGTVGETCSVFGDQSQGLIDELNYIDGLGVSWWDRNKLYVLIPACVLFLGIGIWGIKKYW